MSYAKIWIHAVWSTKVWKPHLSDDIQQSVFDHIKENGRSKNINIDCCNGYINHIHCLISLGRNQTIADCLQLIKGESSFWINRNKMIPGKCMWQDDYYAVSVDESRLEQLRNYIRNQEAHHRKIPFEQELEEFKKQYELMKG